MEEEAPCGGMTGSQPTSSVTHNNVSDLSTSDGDGDVAAALLYILCLPLPVSDYTLPDTSRYTNPSAASRGKLAS